VPLTSVKCDKLAVLDTRNGFGTRVTFLSEQKAVAEDAVRRVLDRRELVATDLCVAVGALEALAVPRSARKHDAGFGYGATAFGTLLTILSLIAWHTDHFISPRYETRRADLFLTHPTREALGVPLSTPVLVFLHTRSEDGTTERAARCKVVLVTCRAV